ncbi:MAG: metallophosphoesterase, partial [Cyanobacteria bacterium SZAS LIN-2]|nr:metallophosphoesterase [Cyanobacteria bacterium SZAS LIN-2]
MRDSGFASGLGETSSQNLLVNRRRFLLGLTSILSLSPLALGPLAKEASAQANFEPFSFAFISDVHLSTGQADTTVLLQESQLFLQDVVKQLNQHKLDFIVFGGDQVEGPGKDDSFWNLFIDVCQNLNAPWFFVLGEADVSGRRAVDKMDAYGPDFKGRNLTSGKPYWSTDPVPNVHLIGLDTSRP